MQAFDQHLTTPIKFTGGLTQCIGRILRTAQGKDTATVYNYVDSNIGVLAASFKSRLWAYKNLGIDVEYDPNPYRKQCTLG